jgi:hypothetical protein
MLGIGTNPAGRTVSPQDLLNAFEATRGSVAGYWLNIPGTGRCPSCGTPQPQVAVQFLQMLGAQG